MSHVLLSLGGQEMRSREKSPWGELSPCSDGSVTAAVGVVHDGVEGLIQPLPEHHGWGLPEEQRHYFHSVPHPWTPTIKPQGYPPNPQKSPGDDPRTCSDDLCMTPPYTNTSEF